MAERNFEQDMLFAKQEWDSFVFSLRNDIKKLIDQDRKLVVDIKKIERLEKIMEISQRDAKTLIEHKNLILEIDGTLSQKLAIVEAFGKRKNLDNPVAKRTVGDILNSRILKAKIEDKEEIKSRRDSLEAEISKIDGLIRGNLYDRDTIVKYSNMYDFTPKSKIAIQLYPIYRSSRKTKNETFVRQEVTNYKNEYDELYKKYEDTLSKHSDLLNKYFEIVNSFSEDKINYYKINRIALDDEGKKIINAIDAFGFKSVIEKYSKAIKSSNYTRKNSIELFASLVDAFVSLADTLNTLDKAVVEKKTSVEDFVRSNVYFLTDRNSQPFLPNDVTTKENIANLIELTQKQQNNSEDVIIRPARINRKFEEEVGRKVLIAEDPNIKTSYIELNSRNNAGGIMILTAALDDEGIKNNTDMIIRDNKRQIAWQVASIERQAVEQIGVQESVKEELVKSLKQDELGEGSGLNGNGRLSK